MIEKIDNDRVIFVSSDSEYYIYILEAEEINCEGDRLVSCFEKNDYKSKILNGNSIILSLRDKFNKPHVITEIDVESNKIIQQIGKSNSEPESKYKKIMIEFILFATNYNKTN